MGACASVPKAMRSKFAAAAPPPEQPKEEETTTAGAAEAATVVKKEGGEADDKKEEKAVEESAEKSQSLEGEAPNEKESKDLKGEILPVAEPAAEKKPTDAAPVEIAAAPSAAAVVAA